MLAHVPPPGDTISETPLIIADRYRCGRILGTGATSTVYEGQDLSTRAGVAIKRIARDISSHRGGGDLLRREVGVANTVTHPGLVEVYDAGAESDGSFFIVMELLEGETFEDFLLRRPTDLEASLDVLEGVLEPLTALHERGIVHRDIKPSNIFVTRTGQVKLLDLGIAKHSADVSVTKTGAGVGTPHYMAPEQALNARDVTPAADVWSIGAMLYRILTGAVPFDGDGAYEVVLKACTEDLPRIVDRTQGVDERFVRFVDLCTAKTPELRLADAGQALATLRAIRRGASNPFAAAALANPALASLARSGPRLASADDATEPAFRDVEIPRGSRAPLMIGIAFCILAMFAGALVVMSSVEERFTTPAAHDPLPAAPVAVEEPEPPPVIPMHEVVIEPPKPPPVVKKRRRSRAAQRVPAPKAPAEPEQADPAERADATSTDLTPEVSAAIDDDVEEEAAVEAVPDDAIRDAEEPTPPITASRDAGSAPASAPPPPPVKKKAPKPFLTF